MLPINRKISLVNFTDRNTKPTYIVIHYVGAVSTAANNANYFYSTYRAASAHYFIDENSIWQVVEDNDTAWQVGGNKYPNTAGGTFHGIATNSNTLGFEMCVKKDANGNWYYEQATLNNTRDIVQAKMKEYGIPAERVIRHYDVTGKACPANYLDDASWGAFKAFLVGSTSGGAAVTPPVVKPQPTPSTGNIAVGSIVTLSTSATNYATGPKIPVRYLGQNYTVQQVKADRVLLKELYSWVYIKDLVGGIPSISSTPNIGGNIGVGSKVVLLNSATHYATGPQIPPRYKGRTYTIQQVKGDRVLLQEITSWVYTKDVSGGSVPTQSTPAPTRKSNEEIANEIIRGTGEWYKVTGQARKDKLRAMGYDPAAVQAIINSKL